MSECQTALIFDLKFANINFPRVRKRSRMETFAPPPQFSYISFHPQIHRPPINPTATPHRPHILSTLNFFNTASRVVELYANTTTFLLFSLHHQHHRHNHICIVFPSPPPHFYCFHSSYCFPTKQANLRPK